MIRHIIMFKFTEVNNEMDRLEKCIRMKTTFEPLKSKLNIIKSYTVGINQKKTDFSYDVVIISEYKNWEDLESYINHPEHQKAIGLCNDIKKEKAIVDYEY